jgi:serine protease Do
MLLSVVRADDEKPMGYMGVMLDQAQDGKGIIITGVNQGSPADKAGLKPDDVILKLDGKEVGDLQDFVKHVKSSKPGDKLTLTVRHEGKEQEIKVTVGEPPKMDG